MPNILLLKNIAHTLKSGGYILKSLFSSFSGVALQLVALQLISLLLGFATNYILIKRADTEAYGSYVYYFNLLAIFCQIGLFGANTLLIKMGGIYKLNAQYSSFKGLYYASLIVVLASSLLFGFAGTFFSPLFKELTPEQPVALVFQTVFILSLLSTTQINQAALQGLHFPVQSQASEKLVKPLLFLILLAISFIAGLEVSVALLIALQMAAIAGTSFLSFCLLRRNTETAIDWSVQSRYRLNEWAKPAAAFFLIAVATIINSRIDIVLLGQLGSIKATGIYNIALKLSEIIPLALTIINIIIAPRLATLYSKKKFTLLQRLLTRSARTNLLISLPVILLLVCFRQPLLSFFNISSSNAVMAFTILCAGHVINILFGSVGTLLLMTGHQQYVLLGMGAGLLINIILNFVLTPAMGIIGTAIATASGLGIWNLLMYIFVRIKMNVRTTAFGIL